MENRWILRPVEDEDAVSRMQQELNDLPEALARALVVRDVDSFEKARRFFRPSRSYLHEPFQMAHMDRAADRMARAIRERENVLVYGDYDVDGTTSTAMTVDFLREQGVETAFFIPDRYGDGYGLGERGLDRAKEFGADLVVALDCGITAHEEAEYARELGLDLIICDHHTPGERLPRATAVLDPKRRDCDYPFDALSGCGVGFKLIQATVATLGQSAEEVVRHLDLLALSIASDVVPIGGENRILMREGLKILRDDPRPGIRALADEVDLEVEQISAGKIGWVLGPRINAAGRMDSARQAVELLLASNLETGRRLATELEQLNQRRRFLDQSTQEEAKEKADALFAERDRSGLVLYDPDWHLGVLGIVAGRMVEEFYRPVVLLSRDEGRLTGSARSVDGFNVYEALAGCEELLTRFGGHDYAAGMSLAEEDLEAFRDRFEEVVAKTITEEQLSPAIEVDAELPLADISDRFWKVLEQFEPHGPTNPRPVFRGRNLEVVGDPREVGSGHLKFAVAGNGAEASDSYEVIAFGMADRMETVRGSARFGEPLDLLFNVQLNEWNGKRSLQLKAKDLRLSEDQEDV